MAMRRDETDAIRELVTAQAKKYDNDYLPTEEDDDIIPDNTQLRGRSRVSIFEPENWD